VSLLALPVLALLLGAEYAVSAGAPLEPALARLVPGDTLRLGPGEHHGALGHLGRVRVIGAGPGVTVILAPEGQDGVVAVPAGQGGAAAAGPLELSDLSLVTGPRRSALKVLGGRVSLARVALVGGTAGAFVEEGELDGRGVTLAGEYGLLLSRGTVRLRDVTASGTLAGVGSLRGDLTLERAVVTGPAIEAGVSIAGGTARLVQVAIRRPGPSGLSILGGEVEATDLTVAGAVEEGGLLGDCVQVLRGGLVLRASELLACGGAALEASRARLTLDGVDAAGGEAGGLVLIDRTTATLDGLVLTRGGPGLVAMQGSTARGFGNRFWTEPAIWADCAGGTVVDLRGDPAVRRPCLASPPGQAAPPGDPGDRSLDKPRSP